MRTYLLDARRDINDCTYLLDARREIDDCKTGETYICFGATAKEMEEEWVSDSPISRYGKEAKEAKAL